MPLVLEGQRLFLCRPYAGLPVRWPIFSAQHFSQQSLDFLRFRAQLMCSI